MSNIDKQALREAADAANETSWGRWESYHPHKGARGYEVKVGVRAVAQHCLKVDAAFIAAANPVTVLALLDELEAAEHTAAVDHEAACSLVEENEEVKRKLAAAEKRIAEQREYYEGVIADGSRRIAELERSETQLIDERDNAEAALNDAYKAVMGQAPEWSNWFSFADAIDEIELACEQWRNQADDVIQFRQRIAELEAHPYLPQPLNIKDEYQNYEYVSGWNDCRNAANVREHTAAICDVIAERYRQQSVEGWTPEHDDEHMHCEMAVAAACYIMADDDPRAGVPELWPWPEEWWKPTTIRRDLVKAGALVLAEIERIDRAAGIGIKGE